MQNEKCEQCGGALEFRKNGSVQGYFCKGCDWALVTTFIPDIQLDETQYTIAVSGGDYHNELHIKAVADASQINFLSARKLLQQVNPEVFKGEATKVIKVRESLSSAGLICNINPPFSY